MAEERKSGGAAWLAAGMAGAASETAAGVAAGTAKTSLIFLGAGLTALASAGAWVSSKRKGSRDQMAWAITERPAKILKYLTNSGSFNARANVMLMRDQSECVVWDRERSAGVQIAFPLGNYSDDEKRWFWTPEHEACASLAWEQGRPWFGGKDGAQENVRARLEALDAGVLAMPEVPSAGNFKEEIKSVLSLPLRKGAKGPVVGILNLDDIELADRSQLAHEETLRQAREVAVHISGLLPKYEGRLAGKPLPLREGLFF